MRSIGKVDRWYGKEQRLGMSIFTYLLDLCVLQSFSIYELLEPENKEVLSEYKRVLCEELIDELKLEKIMKILLFPNGTSTDYFTFYSNR